MKFRFNRTVYFVAWTIVFALGACGPAGQSGNRLQTEVAPVPSSERGKVLYSLCASCHGALGEGNAALNAPVLANSEGWYLTRQLMNFKNGIRGNNRDTLGLQMATISKSLTDSLQVLDVVAYIASLDSVRLVGSTVGDQKKGERLYQSVCGACHGAGGKGNEQMNAPRLNGLNPWYIRRQLDNFKAGVRGDHPDDTFGSQMIPMANMVTSPEALENLLAYLRSGPILKLD